MNLCFTGLSCVDEKSRFCILLVLRGRLYSVHSGNF